MSGDDADLTDFGLHVSDEILPLIDRKAIIWSPTAPTKPAGFVGLDRRRDFRVYTTRRKRYHFYREGDGYAISDSILAKINRVGIPRIIIHTANRQGVYEFTTRQYVHEGKSVPTHELLDENDPQTYIPVTEAKNVWDRDSNPNDLFVQEFSDAMDRILSERSY